MNKTTNSDPAPGPAVKNRPDVALALDTLEISVTTLEELVGTLVVKLSPVCSDWAPVSEEPAESLQSMCQVSAFVRGLDTRAYALACHLRHLHYVLEI